MYSFETLLGYLGKLLNQASICRQNEQEIFTSLFLSLHGMINWLVISESMTEFLEKMK